jgi:hypothetical protein
MKDVCNEIFSKLCCKRGKNKRLQLFNAAQEKFNHNYDALSLVKTI